ncbi:amiloride-sensitive sodium channel subunit alpha [Caerostris darwini]|uniref:Amiloride-sensitive sodium channel subunit alpha n=1 Tax=Caerostris darwini TaxID=1538125 RepID=A0AAV4WIF5_9ARAC|nr:amiloride-sensitive sodium channel subunit alpha [Caerostris darwini]
MVTTLNIEQEKSSEFPAVSICNINRKKNLFKKLHDKIYGAPLLISERRSIFQCNDKQIINSATAQKSLIDYYRLSAKGRYAAGHRHLELIQKCVFRDHPCRDHYFTLFQNFRYGNCVTFNKRIQNTTALSVSETGPGSGLILELYLEEFLYTSHIVGARVIIHDPDSTPSPEDEGFNISPGYETFVSLKKTTTYRLPAPFRDKCVDYRECKGFSISNKNECVRACIQVQNYEKCNCTDKTLVVMSDLTPCNMSNDAEMCCLNDVIDNLANIKPICDCPQPCRFVNFNEKLSMAIWPSKALVRKEEKYIAPDKDILRLNVFYSTLERTTYTQKPMFEKYELLSFLGCELGLWLGLSLIAVFEFIEKIPSVSKKAFTNINLKRSRKKVTQQNILFQNYVGFKK